jgi:hypothetical protein
MAVINTTETFEGRSASDDSKAQVTMRRTFLVRTNSNYDDAATVAQGNIPAMFSVHPNFSKAFVVGRDFQPTEDPQLWKVVVSYSSNLDTVTPSSSPSAPQTPEVAKQQQGSSPAERVVNPLLRPTDVDFSTVDRPKLLLQDYHTTPLAVVNAIFEKFDPPVETERPVLNMHLEFNTATFFAADWMDRVKTVNNAAFSGYPARSMFLDRITSKRVYENEVKYWRISLDIALDKELWDILVLNHSYCEIDPDTSDIVAAVDKSNKPLPNGVILDEDGYRLDAGVEPTELNGGLIRFYKYKPISWSWLTPIYNNIL